MEQPQSPRRVTDAELRAATDKIELLMRERGTSLTVAREIRNPDIAEIVTETFRVAIQLMVTAPDATDRITQVADMLAMALKEPEKLIARFAEAASDVEWVDRLIPQILPATWKSHPNSQKGLGMFENVIGLTAILSGKTEDDGRRWLHLSVSHPKRVPTYDEMCECKELFLRDLMALQLFVPKAQHVNVHEFCLHLWASLDPLDLPDFRRGLGIV